MASADFRADSRETEGDSTVRERKSSFRAESLFWTSAHLCGEIINCEVQNLFHNSINPAQR